MCPTALALAAALALPSVPLTPTRPPPAGGFPPTYAGILLLRQNKGVQDELKMTEEQVVALDKTMGDLQAKLREVVGAGREDRDKLGQRLKEFQAESAKAAAAFLKPEQAARLGQIELQAGGVIALSREDVQKELNLTDRQKELLQEAKTRYQAEMRKLRSEVGADLNAYKARLQELQQKTGEEYVGSLTEEQRRRWKELTGAPFVLKR
jgi:hypothetical protein